MGINERTLVSKLAFAFFGDASAASLQKLEMEFIGFAQSFAKERSDSPSAEQIGEWMKGRPLRKVGHYRFFKFVVEQSISNREFYASLTPDQKKVFKQIDRLLAKRSSPFEPLEFGPNGAGNTGTVKWLELKLISASLAENLASVRDDLEQERPNHPEGILAIEKSIEVIEMVEGHLGRIDAALVPLIVSNTLNDDDDVCSVLDQVAEEFKNWITENKPEVVDTVMRLTPATAFLGMLGLAGANMTWATPMVLAICGGKSVVEILKNIKN